MPDGSEGSAVNTFSQILAFLTSLRSARQGAIHSAGHAAAQSSSPSSDQIAGTGSSGGAAILYPDQYFWYILVGILDIVVTYVVLLLGGSEVNSIANQALHAFGHWGLVGIKFASIAVVVLICEFIGRRRGTIGRTLAITAVGISAAPPAIGLAQLATVI